ncbi:MAG: hypothetical protein LN412_01645 [Candidatus Thermoplasmatota archaeon]|nr:hypothetical protein [Candidatus Thermoplasmatota archaeon]
MRGVLQIRGKKPVIVSWDLRQPRITDRARVNRLVFGRKVSKETRDRVATCNCEGYIHRYGIVYLGQSVLMLPESLSSSLVEELGRINVLHRTW